MNTEAAASAQPETSDQPLSQRLRERRLGLKLTLKDVADKAGFSVGYISQIERGITTPSLTSLIAVCRVLDADVGQFLSQPRGEAPVTRHAERPVYAVAGDGMGIGYERLSAAFPGNVLRSVLMHQPPGYRSETMTHEGEEMFFVLQGALTVEVEGEATVLEAGDLIHFPSSRLHATWNHTAQTATMLHTCTIDVFNDGTPADTGEGVPAIRRASDRSEAVAPAGAPARPQPDSDVP